MKHTHAQPVVIKLGGTLLEPTNITRTARAISVYSRTASLPGGLVVVHGGGAMVTDMLRAHGHESVFKDGVRVTPPEQIDLVASTLHGTINAELCLELRARGVDAQSLRASDAGTIRVEPLDPALGFGCVADASPGDAGHVRSLLAAGVVPVLSSIGSVDGVSWNINADTAAGAIAATVGAEMLLLVSDVPGVLDAYGHMLASLDEDSARELMARGVISGGMVAKIKAALQAAMIAGCTAIILNIDALSPDSPGPTVVVRHQPVGTHLRSSRPINV